jgi:hypothetical protein
MRVAGKWSISSHSASFIPNAEGNFVLGHEQRYK